MRSLVKSLFLVWFGSALLLTGTLAGGDRNREAERLSDARDLYNPATARAVSKGLRFIAQRQNRQGYWDESEYALAVSAMAGLALMGDGHPRRGRYGPHLRMYTDYLLSQMAGGPGLISRRGEDRRAYGHAFSLLFLTQIYGMLSREKNQKVRQAILKAIRYMVQWQDRSGCWYQDYDPGGHNQIVTISQVQALRAANSTGFKVRKDVIDKAVRFIENFSFSGPSKGRRASSAATLLAAGQYAHPKLQEALSVMRKEYRSSPSFAFGSERLPFPIFTHMYAAQVMYFLGGEDWENYYRRFRAAVLRKLVQDTRKGDQAYWNAYLEVHAFRPGAVYSTANICMILQMPLDTIPYLQTVKADLGRKR